MYENRYVYMFTVNLVYESFVYENRDAQYTLFMRVLCLRIDIHSTLCFGEFCILE